MTGFRDRLRAALAVSSRSVAADQQYAPELSYGRHTSVPLVDVKRGAVLCLFFPTAGDWSLVLTERTSHLSSHAGQISFPGGRIERDETPEQAALREYEEELGLPG